MLIPFNKPFIVGKELYNISLAVFGDHLSGNGRFSKECAHWLEQRMACRKALLTHSCTGALEMMALLLNIGPGDEIIMPSHTFVSTASAFVLRGGVPVFVDIRADTLNMDENKIEAAITKKTKAIVAVHYAGVACEMDAILAIAQRHDMDVLEDAAQGLLCTYKGRQLGAFGRFSAFSFHETKNLISGEGGALLINRDEDVERAEILWEKGTNRRKFFRGEVDKYTWVDLGSSFYPSELVTAFLFAQLEKADEINQRRKALFTVYWQGLKILEQNGFLRLPTLPENTESNGHMFWILLKSEAIRSELMAHLKERGIYAVWHYSPLHMSPMGQLKCRQHAQLPVTENICARLLRLPIYYEMTAAEQDYVILNIIRFFEK